MMYLEVFAALFFIFLVWNLKNTYVKGENSPPGPFPLPIIGNLHQIGLYPLLSLSVLKQQYPDVMMLKFSTINLLILNSFAAVEEALITRKSDFAGRPSEIYPMDLVLLRDVAGSDYGDIFALRRKIFKAAFQTSGKILVDLDQRLHVAIRELLKIVGETHERPFVLSKPVQSALIVQLWQRLAGVQISFDDPIVKKVAEFNHELSVVTGSCNLAQFFPAVRYIPTAFSRKVDHVVNLRDDVFGSMVKDHLKTYKEGEIRDVIDALLATFYCEREKCSGKIELDIGDIKFLVMDVFVGATDTSIGIIEWVILYLAVMPEFQQKVQQSLDKNMPADRLPYSSDVNNFHYLNATVCEVFRLIVMTPFLFPHRTTCDTQVMGYKIPNKTMILVDQQSLHYDPKYWPEPEVFKPERFLDEKGFFVGWYAKKSFIPFGLGRRACPGQDLAKVQNVITLACLLHNFEFRLPDGQPAPKLRNFSPKVVGRADPYEIIATKRK